jgi:hypothetical protein
MIAPVIPGSERWGFYILQGIAEAVEKAVAEHEREGRGDIVRACIPNPDGTMPPWNPEWDPPRKS